jgi:hypothetical protein
MKQMMITFWLLASTLLQVCCVEWTGEQRQEFEGFTRCFNSYINEVP